MRHTPFYALGLLLTVTQATFGFEDSNNHYLRRHAHKHRRKDPNENVGVSIDIDVDVHIGSGHGGSKDHPSWKLTDDFKGKNFYEHFTFEAIPDPTHGRVNYVDMQTAMAKNLTEVKNGNLILRADSTTVLDPNGPGRDSIRMQSKKQWTTGVSVFNLNHMPEGCGTWPAYWMTQVENWPVNGEIDILEGVHDQPPNHSALHTVTGCVVPLNRTMTGTATAANCSWLHNYNQGCPVQWARTDSYGPPLNKMGAGWFVTERTEKRISIWFWGRNDNNVPFAIKQGLPIICTKDFGIPAATWDSSDECEFKKIMGLQNIIINLTMCGDWAGQDAIFQGAGCPGTCVDYVNKNPASFKNAYWDIASLKVYSRAL
ncbi:putative glycosidase C21B10,07 OS=Schizosaccharomyces pombe (strain 972 / ATCC 24843) GN=SPBC21B10.07 PE=3 SV=1 [Rhizoctonia solani AG-1 IB]|uniref:GH16 domain-containing protein n=3 Tax=Rhizoctonia solani TaxID=456999 RepID=A0A8H3GMM5_9AGAM|nr:unnamed protein product [Rhizoctonia solani]CEL58358.1 putative glycosidase C21B10,07 OS=Schizosaccharomyces pombe (strain 972 / ATCC 24843) GN=SPBC21B10.07 PE=3 SV=1 [Rhizoctonia solani AG-1 IB]